MSSIDNKKPNGPQAPGFQRAPTAGGDTGIETPRADGVKSTRAALNSDKLGRTKSTEVNKFTSDKTRPLPPPAGPQVKLTAEDEEAWHSFMQELQSGMGQGRVLSQAGLAPDIKPKLSSATGKAGSKTGTPNANGEPDKVVTDYIHMSGSATLAFLISIMSKMDDVKVLDDLSKLHSTMQTDAIDRQRAKQNEAQAKAREAQAKAEKVGIGTQVTGWLVVALAAVLTFVTLGAAALGGMLALTAIGATIGGITGGSKGAVQGAQIVASIVAMIATFGSSAVVQAIAFSVITGAKQIADAGMKYSVDKLQNEVGALEVQAKWFAALVKHLQDSKATVEEVIEVLLKAHDELVSKAHGVLSDTHSTNMKTTQFA